MPVSVAIDSIDDVTGLLGREGMAWEIAFGARVGLKHGLLLTRPA